jgi:hypothetical protein
LAEAIRIAVTDTQPYPKNRLLMVDGGRLGRHKHTVHGLVEFDITQARQAIRQHKALTGQALSFSAFFLACLGQAIDQDRQTAVKETGRKRSWAIRLGN